MIQSFIERTSHVNTSVLLCLIAFVVIVFGTWAVTILKNGQRRQAAMMQTMTTQPTPTLTNEEKKIITDIAEQQQNVLNHVTEVIIKLSKQMEKTIMVTVVSKTRAVRTFQITTVPLFLETLKYECSLHQWGTHEDQDGLHLTPPRKRAKLPSTAAA
jgi:hypothetical protein